MSMGAETMETYTLTEAKAKLSFIISQVAFAGKRIVIKRKGKSVAAVVPYEEYARKWAEEEHGGLLLAKGALAEMEDFDQFIDDIYRAREGAGDRNVKVV